jgi:hypothetical protein
MMVRKGLVMFLFFLALAIVASMFVPAIFGGGCDPNETCLPGENPIAVHCSSGSCWNYASSGYCIYCEGPPPAFAFGSI